MWWLSQFLVDSHRDIREELLACLLSLRLPGQTLDVMQTLSPQWLILPSGKRSLYYLPSCYQRDCVVYPENLGFEGPMYLATQNQLLQVLG